MAGRGNGRTDALHRGAEVDGDVHEVTENDGHEDESAEHEEFWPWSHLVVGLRRNTHGSRPRNALGEEKESESESMAGPAVVKPRSILSRVLSRKARAEASTTVAPDGKVMQKRGRKSIQKAKNRRQVLANANFFQLFESLGAEAAQSEDTRASLAAQLAAAEAEYEAALRKPTRATVEPGMGPVDTYLGPAGLFAKIQDLRERLAKVASLDDYLLNNAQYLGRYQSELDRVRAEYVLRDIGQDATDLRVVEVAPSMDPVEGIADDGTLADESAQRERDDDEDEEEDDDRDNENMADVSTVTILSTSAVYVHAAFVLLDGAGVSEATTRVIALPESMTVGSVLAYVKSERNLFPACPAVAKYKFGSGRRGKGCPFLFLLDGSGCALTKQTTLAMVADRECAGSARTDPLLLALCPTAGLPNLRLRLTATDPGTVRAPASRLGAIMNSFLVDATGEQLNSSPAVARQEAMSRCSRCGEATVRDAAAAEMVCTNPKCAVAVHYFEATRAHLNFEDRPLPSNGSESRGNKRRNFMQILNESQGKEAVDIPEDLVEAMQKAQKAYHYTYEDLTEACMKEMLKNIGCDKYYRHIPKIRWKMTGVPPKTLTKQQEEQLISDYDLLQKPFEIFSKGLRQNMFFFRYTFNKLCEKNGYLEFLQSGNKSMKSTDNLGTNDDIMKKMFDYLGWPWTYSM